jgi:cytochrome o ubiquinol oxidase subunit 2
MSGMETQLHLIADSPGVYAGQSSAFSGPGFSDMHFKTIASSRRDFDAWIAQAKQSSLTLNKATYRLLTQPSIKAPVSIYSGVAQGLFDDIVDQYMRGNGANAMCRTPSTAESPLPNKRIGAQLPATLAAE